MPNPTKVSPQLTDHRQRRSARAQGSGGPPLRCPKDALIQHINEPSSIVNFICFEPWRGRCANPFHTSSMPHNKMRGLTARGPRQLSKPWRRERESVAILAQGAYTTTSSTTTCPSSQGGKPRHLVPHSSCAIAGGADDCPFLPQSNYLFVRHGLDSDAVPPCAYLTPCPGVYTHTHTHTHTRTHPPAAPPTSHHTHPHTTTIARTHCQWKNPHQGVSRREHSSFCSTAQPAPFTHTGTRTGQQPQA